MPDQPKTKHRTIRIDDTLWDAYGELVDDRTAVIRDFLRWYVREPGVKLPKRPDVSPVDKT